MRWLRSAAQHHVPYARQYVREESYIGRGAVLLDDLVSVIETLKARLETHRQVLQANETRTRMALIDPLLQSLGWDTAYPSLVLPEYEVGGRQAADYALLDATDKPIALVEAKRLGESLASHREQIVRYAILSGVPYAGLTDGDHWELYRAFNPSPFDRSSFEDRLLLNLSIADRPAHEVALNLLLLWRPNLAAGQPVAVSDPILTPVHEPVMPEPVSEPEIERPTPMTPEQVQEQPPDMSGWTPLSELATPAWKSSFPMGTYKPRVVKFPDGSTREVQFWWELPASIAGWLWSKGMLTASKTPIEWNKRTHIANMDGMHPSGRPFAKPRKVAGTPLVFEARLKGEEVINRSRKLLEECDVNMQEVQLQVG